MFRIIRIAMSLFVVFAAYVFVVAGLELPMTAGAAQTPAAQAPAAVQEAPPSSEESIAKGREVFYQFCRSCHGADGKGVRGNEMEPPNLIDEEWIHGGTDAEVFTTIKMGVEPNYYMEPWEGRITDEQIWSVIHFLRDLAQRSAAPAPPQQ